MLVSLFRKNNQINISRFYQISKHSFSQQKLKQKIINPTEISIKFSSNKQEKKEKQKKSKQLHENKYLTNDLSKYLTKNKLKFNEISDIILKYPSNSNNEHVYREIENYLNIKREINTFPSELHSKILQYARDTSNIGIDVNLIRKQIKNELLSINEAKTNIDNISSTMEHISKNKQNSCELQLNDDNKLRIILLNFINKIDTYLQNESDKIILSKNKAKSNNLSSKILAIIDPRRSAEIGIKTLIDHFNHYTHNDNGVPFSIICSAIGKEIERDLFLQNKLSKSSEISSFLSSELKKYNLSHSTHNYLKSNKRLSLAKNLGIKIGDTFNYKNIYEIGSLILESIINSCFIDNNNVFYHEIIYENKKKIGSIKCNDTFRDILISSTIIYKKPNEIHPVSLPMIIPPIQWKNIDQGPFFYYNESLMRYRNYKNQYKQLKISDNNINNLMQCINILQSTAWKINKNVLNIINYLYENENGGFAGLPPKYDQDIPEKDDNDPDNEYKRKQIEKLNAEQHSLRCDFRLKMNLAQELISYNSIYFPLNIDFRGRVYPISPHISHIGSDVVRGLFKFSHAKEIGERGWFWLNVNLANKFGFDKVSNRERYKWATAPDKIINILNVYSNPLKFRWWLDADSPFQALSICCELGKIYRYEKKHGSKSKYKYKSNLPIGQDGSCNGLQHYAAMLSDENMAKHVNVANNNKRGDVYSAVKDCVIKLVENDLNSPNVVHKYLANLIHGQITRKLVKQTVMTSVYGVTPYGAKEQISKWISSAIEDGDLKFDNNPDIEINTVNGEKLLILLSNYIGKYTIHSIGQTNTPAFLSMLWLKYCANRIASSGYRVSWMTPELHLPCTQHYVNKKNNTKITTAMQTLEINDINSVKENDNINRGKQTNGFPPNFVHSLDSTHCLLTAKSCYLKHGLTFASIHDSFWTHPSDIDIMNKVLREQFIKLHEKPLLNQLYNSLCILYPDIDFPPPPKQSTFDIKEVKDSEFFFS